MVFEEVLELAHKRVLDALVNPDLRHQLLLGSGLCERGFLDELAREHSFSFVTDKLIALREASFP